MTMTPMVERDAQDCVCEEIAAPATGVCCCIGQGRLWLRGEVATHRVQVRVKEERNASMKIVADVLSGSQPSLLRVRMLGSKKGPEGVTTLLLEIKIAARDSCKVLIQPTACSTSSSTARILCHHRVTSTVVFRFKIHHEALATRTRTTSHTAAPSPLTPIKKHQHQRQRLHQHAVTEQTFVVRESFGRRSDPIMLPPEVKSQGTPLEERTVHAKTSLPAPFDVGSVAKRKELPASLMMAKPLAGLSATATSRYNPREAAHKYRDVGLDGSAKAAQPAHNQHEGCTARVVPSFDFAKLFGTTRPLPTQAQRSTFDVSKLFAT